MRLKIRELLAVCCLATVVMGCAKEEEANYTVTERLSLDAWIAQYAPRAMAFGNNGLYVEVIKEGTGDYVKATDWVRVNYTGKNLHNEVFYTRSKDVAELQGTFTKYTHYVPNLLYMYENNVNMTKGMYEVLLSMRKGEVVRIYMPSDYAYGSSGYSNSSNVGYSGQFSLKGNVPIMIDSLQLLYFSASPIGEELSLVEQIATGVGKLPSNLLANWGVPNVDITGWGMDLADSVKKGFYLKMETPIPIARDSIKEGETIQIYYTGRFLDGFLLDSNVDSIQAHERGQITNVGPYEWNFSTDTTVIAAFKQIPKMCYGDKFRMIFTSDYGYSAVGQSAKYSTSSSSSSFSYSDYLQYTSYMEYLQDMYGYGGGSGYGSSFSNYYNFLYGNYYDLYYSGYGNTSSTEEETAFISTEVLPYTPLVYDIYILPKDEQHKDLDDSNNE